MSRTPNVLSAGQTPPAVTMALPSTQSNTSIRDIIGLLRVDQWVKNGFILFPAFFAGQLLAEGMLLRLVAGFFLFSLTASAVYILNDLRDITDDRAHPVKRERPIASGRVSIGMAWTFLIGCFASGLLGSWYLDDGFFQVLVAYGVLNLAYSYGLKRVPVLDITCIAMGFLLRIHAGGFLAHLPISMWIEIMTFLLALFIALAKRRDDVLLSRSGHQVRKSIAGYGLEMVQASMVMVASITVVAYIQYTITEEVIQRMGTARLYYTSVFVLLGMLRYFQLALVHERTGSPTKLLLRDLPLQLIVIAWIASFAIVLYAR